MEIYRLVSGCKHSRLHPALKNRYRNLIFSDNRQYKHSLYFSLVKLVRSDKCEGDCRGPAPGPDPGRPAGRIFTLTRVNHNLGQRSGLILLWRGVNFTSKHYKSLFDKLVTSVTIWSFPYINFVVAHRRSFLLTKFKTFHFRCHLSCVSLIQIQWLFTINTELWRNYIILLIMYTMCGTYRWCCRKNNKYSIFVSCSWC